MSGSASVADVATVEQPAVTTAEKNGKAKASGKRKGKGNGKQGGSAQKQEKGGKKGGQKQGFSIEAQKEENFGEWYQQIIHRCELIENYDISGCYILRPLAYGIWEHIQEYFDKKIKRSGVKNCYFPLLVSKTALETESDFIADFAPEVAWVTRGGKSDLEEPVAIRPTSETVMYPSFAKWIRSHRDLPLRINQWSNIVRWEFKDPVPFIRSREFLWQEGHSAFANQEDADREVLEILEYYRQIYEDLLCCPCILGRKTDKEKFAGGDYTTTCEAFIPTVGRGVQGATSHCLGQNFAKGFKIEFENEDKQKCMPIQNSWGITTRTLGVLFMVHADNKGLVLPPRVAPDQVVVIPLHFKGKDWAAVDSKAQEIVDRLRERDIRAICDASTDHNPGWKYNYYERLGVPLRVEVGPRDLENKTVMACRRDSGEKCSVADDGLEDALGELLETIQTDMLERATKQRDSQMKTVTEWKEFTPTLNDRNIILSPWCKDTKCEEDIKKTTHEEALELATGGSLTGAAKSLCMPFKQPELAAGTNCVRCGEEAKIWCLFGRSY